MTNLLQEFDPITFDYPVTIIGCGSVGSRIAEGITRMGLGIAGRNPIHLYDPIFFSNDDLYNAWIDSAGLWKSKARVIAGHMQSINPEIYVIPHRGNAQADSVLRGVVFLCTNNLNTNQALIETIQREQRGVTCIIESRLLSTGIASYCFNPHYPSHMEQWHKHREADKESDQSTEDQSSMIGDVFMASGFALSQFELFAQQQSSKIPHNHMYYDPATCTLVSHKWAS